MLRVNITGGIGSGKSTVANFFAKLGIAVADTDQIAHSLTASNGVAIPLIRNAFGEQFIDTHGAMNRPIMRDYVFANPSARTALEQILHPLIRSETQSFIKAAQSPYVMVQIPLLVESLIRSKPLQSDARNLVVDCLETEQIARVCARNTFSVEQVKTIMSAQVSRTTRLSFATDVVANFNHQVDLEAQLSRLHAIFLRLNHGN